MGRALSALAIAGALAAGCSSGRITPPDSGPGLDSGPRPDAGPSPDAGDRRDASDDASSIDVDAFVAPDATVDVDAAMPVDGGTSDGGTVDGGPDGGPVPSAIERVRATDADVLPTPIFVDAVMVTRVRPAIGGDPAGFFVQSEVAGPALFVAVDPATLTPVPAPGDFVGFDVTGTDVVFGQHRVISIASFGRTDTGFDPTALAQDVSAVDVPAMIAGYESELVTVDATIAGAFVGCGTPHVCAQITTAGVGTPGATYRFRTTDAIQAAHGLRAGCTLRVGPTPLWRRDNADTTVQAQPSAWSMDDVSMVTCPAPTVVGAVATDPTTVVVTFDAPILASSVTPGAFTITGGVTVSNAVASGTSVTLTTSALTSGTTYTVSVAATVTDASGAGVGTPNSAMFVGTSSPATIVVNEFNTNVANGCDLIELRVTAGGSLGGVEVRARGVTLVTFPAGFTVATNDLVVVHLDRADTTNCTGGGPTTDETTSVTQLPASTQAANYDTAYDFWAMEPGLVATDIALWIVRGSTVIDAVLAASDLTGTTAMDSETAAATIAAAGQWTAIDGSVPAGGFVDAAFRMHAAQDLNATGTTPTGTSIQRSRNADSDDASDWTMTASSFGLINAGQTPL